MFKRVKDKACGNMQVSVADTPMHLLPVCPVVARLAARRQDAGGAAEHLKQLEKDYDWVVREKANFGRGEYVLLFLQEHRVTTGNMLAACSCWHLQCCHHELMLLRCKQTCSCC